MKFFVFAVFSALLAVSDAFSSRALPTFSRSVKGPKVSMDVKVVAGDGEPLESLLRRFKREVNNSGHLMELKHRRYFENGQDIIKRKIKEQRRRIKNERMAARKSNRFGNSPRPPPKPAATAEAPK